MSNVLQELGLAVRDVAASAERAFYAALGTAAAPAGEEDSAGWDRAVAATLLLAEEGAEVSCKQAAARICLAFLEKPEGFAFDALPAVDRAAWEAAARHLQYLLTQYDEREDLPAVEASWGPWARQRLATLERKAV